MDDQQNQNQKHIHLLLLSACVMMQATWPRLLKSRVHPFIIRYIILENKIRRDTLGFIKNMFSQRITTLTILRQFENS